MTLIDVRRHDERTLYGAIRGSVHVPVDQLPKVINARDYIPLVLPQIAATYRLMLCVSMQALLMNDQDWLRALNFPKPGPEVCRQ